MAVLIYIIGFIIFVLIPLPIQILLLLVDVSFWRNWTGDNFNGGRSRTWKNES